MRDGCRSAHARAGVHRPPHALDHLGEVQSIHHRILRLGKPLVNLNALGGLDDVRNKVVPAVGDGGAEVCQVHGRRQDFSLADGKGNHRSGVPASASVGTVVRLGGRNAAAELGREIAPELAPEPKAHHHLPPVVQALGHIVKLALVQDILEHVAVVGVAAHHDALLHVERALVHMAAQLVPGTKVVALVAGIAHLGPEDAFLQADEPVHQLEHRSRRIRSLHRTVVHGFIGVLRNLLPVLADIGQHVYVNTRRAHQRQDFPGLRLDGHDTSHLVSHELLPVLLQSGVDGGDNVLSRDGLLVLGSILVGLFNLVAGVSQENVIALFSAKLLLPGRLNTGHAGIVSAPVFSRMLVNIGLVHFRHISQEVSAGVHGVVADTANLPAEARKLVLYLVKAHVCLGRHGAQHGDRLEADGRPPPPVLLQLFADEGDVHVQHRSQRQGVESLHLPRAHQDIVRNLVSHQDGSVAVVDDTAGGVNGLVDGRVAVCVLLITGI